MCLFTLRYTLSNAAGFRLTRFGRAAGILGCAGDDHFFPSWKSSSGTFAPADRRLGEKLPRPSATPRSRPLGPSLICHRLRSPFGNSTRGGWKGHEALGKFSVLRCFAFSARGCRVSLWGWVVLRPNFVLCRSIVLGVRGRLRTWLVRMLSSVRSVRRSRRGGSRMRIFFPGRAAPGRRRRRRFLLGVSSV